MFNQKKLSLPGLAAFTAVSLTAVGLFIGGSAVQTERGKLPEPVEATEKSAELLRCGTVGLTEEENKIAELAVKRAKGTKRALQRGSGEVIIPVVYHVIRNSSGAGNLTNGQIQAQIRVLNLGYSGRDVPARHLGQVNSAQATANTPFRFRLVAVTRTTNDTWFVDGNEFQMKAALKQGGKETLNIYSVDLGTNVFGYAYLPSDAAGETIDGVVLNYRTIPGGSRAPFNLGDTLTHEVGHWLGLEHTFDGGCSSNSTGGGDFIADTPAQGSAFLSQPTTSNLPDTCSALPGRDPVENFMDYTVDDGMYQFTQGQYNRMDDQHMTFR